MLDICKLRQNDNKIPRDIAGILGLQSRVFFFYPTLALKIITQSGNIREGIREKEINQFFL